MPMDLVFVLKWVKSVIRCALYIFHKHRYLRVSVDTIERLWTPLSRFFYAKFCIIGPPSIKWVSNCNRSKCNFLIFMNEREPTLHLLRQLWFRAAKTRHEIQRQRQWPSKWQVQRFNFQAKNVIWIQCDQMLE